MKNFLAGTLIAAMVFAGASTASAATTQIGAVPQIDSNQPPALTPNGFTVQSAVALGRTYTVPANYGVITAFRHRTGPVSGALTFRVFRPVAPGQYLVVASETHDVTVGTNHRFDTRVPVQSGDVLGLSAVSGVHVAYESENPDDMVGIFGGDAPVGGTAATNDELTDGYFLDVAAVVETDADNDGYGDDTQVVPETTIDSGPKKTFLKGNKKKAKVKFAFSSLSVGSTFECRIDKADYAPCASPFKKKLKKGKYTFEVRATSALGRVDGTPAKQKFKIKQPK